MSEDRHREAIGAQLRNLRLEGGMSQAQLSTATGATQSALSNYERGVRDLPLYLAARIARVFGQGIYPLLPK